MSKITIRKMIKSKRKIKSRIMGRVAHVFPGAHCSAKYATQHEPGWGSEDFVG